MQFQYSGHARRGGSAFHGLVGDKGKDGRGQIERCLYKAMAEQHPGDKLNSDKGSGHAEVERMENMV